MSDIPIPEFLSEQARAVLATPRPPSVPPPVEDTDAWSRYVQVHDAAIAKMYAPLESLPVESELRRPAGVDTYVLTPPDADERGDSPLLLDVHGGALTQCAGDIGRLMSLPNAMRTGLVHWVPDYRMPPAHPFPAALDDVLAVYRAMLEVRAPERIMVCGTSAGGNIAAALMLRLKDEGIPLPESLMLLSPEIDLTESGDSFGTLAEASNMLGSLMANNLLYANGRDLTDPYISPLFGDVAGWPPTLLQAGGRDLFLSNAIRMHRKLRAAGVQAELHVFEAMPHTGFWGAPEDLELDAEIRRFVSARFGRTTAGQMP
ncbi:MULTISPECIES: alpha/beta hydrolase [unclassified Streptomyces]|uniref:alpha/beta hydrolase n=1 Tax=unclassified Streptomyces TaxID=2593676 RepID=UPI0035E357C4